MRLAVRPAANFSQKRINKPLHRKNLKLRRFFGKTRAFGDFMKAKTQKVLERKLEARKKHRLRNLVRSAYQGDRSALSTLEDICRDDEMAIEKVKTILASLQAETLPGRISRTDYARLKNIGARPYSG